MFLLRPRVFLLLSVAGQTGGSSEHWVQVCALTKVRGTCCGGSKSRTLANNHGIVFRPARANQAHANPKKNSISATPYFLVCSISTIRNFLFVCKPLYPYVVHHVASSGTYTAGTRCNCINCGKSLQLFSPLSGCCCYSRAPTTAAIKRRSCHGTTAAPQDFPFVTATNGASPGGFVSVRARARRVNSIIYTVVVLKRKPVRGAPWARSGTCMYNQYR